MYEERLRPERGAKPPGRQRLEPAPSLIYVGHTGTGFDDHELERVSKLLKSRETRQSPFADKIKSNETAHWVQPDLVAQVRFTEWTDDGKLRHPVYLGLRDDKRAESVVREVRQSPEGRHSGVRIGEDRQARTKEGQAPAARARREVAARERAGVGPQRALKNADPAAEAKSPRRAKSKQRARSRRRSARPEPQTLEKVDATAAMTGMQPVVDQLRALEDTRKDGTIELPGGTRIGVTNLAKPFWPKLKLTKGDLLRYYATVAPLILPVVADRPLVMKRFPNGVDDRVAFYQQRRQKEQPPAGVRIETLPDDIDPIVEPGAERFIGGSLITLLYMTQLAAISQDPWFSRVQSPLDADFVALDLDPGEGATLAQVLDVARWVRDELESTEGAGCAEDVGVARPAHLHSASAGHIVRVRAAVLSDRRHGHRRAASEGGDGRAHGQEAQARHRLRRLPAEHPRQDARVCLQRARERLRRRLDAAHLGRSGSRRRPARLHDRHRAGALPRGRRSVGAPADVEARAARDRVREVLA